MPRRHQRDAAPEPLTITPADIPRPPRMRTREEREADADAAAERNRAACRVARDSRVAAAIDYRMCCIPGCDTKVMQRSRPPAVNEYLPLCTDHQVIIKRQVDHIWDDEAVIAIRLEQQALRQEKRDERARADIINMNGGAVEGQMYFLRLNGLIKVGWSSDLISRLKYYGPDVVVLCHYPASRQDETLMHRQLRPYLAKGREWYEDCPLIHDVVAGIVKRHGAPYLTAFWTEPKPDAIKKRKRSA